MRSSVVIRFRSGYDTGKADGLHLGSGVCAMLHSIFRMTKVVRGYTL